MAIVFVLLFGTLSEARINKIVITTITSPTYNGQSFGSVGQYEQLTGTAYGEVDPEDPLNAFIQDIELAPRNARGNVEYSMDISILKPIDESKGNHTIFYDVVNRGSKTSFSVGVTTSNPAGDGFLENQGFTVVRSGWQGDLRKDTGLMTATVPVAHYRGGGTITGIVRSEISNLTAAIQTSPIFGGFSTASIGYAPVSTDTSKAIMTERVLVDDPPVLIPSNQWAFGSCNPAFPNVTPDPPNPAQDHLCKTGGFDTNHIYELIYQGKDPLVLGLGLAATRDFVSFLRYSKDASNPLAGAIKNALMTGSSQSGRFVRTFLYFGLNQDEQKHIVFEGVNPHISSGRVPLNVRFGQPGRSATHQHTEHNYLAIDSPTTWDTYHDPLSGVTGSILEKCRKTNTCPKVTQTLSDVEYWQYMMSADTTDVFGRRDLPIPENIRIYHFASVQHSGYSPTAALPTSTGICQQLPNANSYTYNQRALWVALYNWAVKNQEPPPSRYPTINGKTLVRIEQVKFPSIPGVSADIERLFHRHLLYYRGPEYDGENMSGIITVEPPIPILKYATLAPPVDADGNDVDGVHSITLRAPLGTYTGWNTRAAGFSEGDVCDLTGSYIPFAKTLADRQASGDPRLSIAERYPTTAAYNAAVTAAANSLVTEGFLLPGDEAAAISQAEQQAAGSGLLP
jgi:hypothetical protein